MDANSIIEGSVKFRDGRKWKSRWCVMSKLSPVADCLHLHLYRDSKDRYKQNLSKASLSLQYFLGLESGFTLDKESNTIAIICQDLIVVLAFETRERLIQWQVKINANLPEGQQYLIQISTSPSKAKLSSGPARLHVQDWRFCLTTGIPPKLAGCWELKHLRRFGVVNDKFCFEGGSLCGKGEGLYALLTDQGDEISRCMQLALEGKIGELKRRPNVLRNLSVYESPCKKGSESRFSADIHFSENCLHSHDTNSNALLPRNNGTVNEDEGTCWPSVEYQAEMYGHGDTTSLGDLTIDSQDNRMCNVWMPEKTLGRCSSCIGKLGMISRPSTAANTPGSMTFNPFWTPQEEKQHINDLSYNTIEEDFKYESLYASANGVVNSTFCNGENGSNSSTSPINGHYSHIDKCRNMIIHASEAIQNHKLSIPLKNILNRDDIQSPPSRPPKPLKYRNQPDNVANSSLTSTRKLNKPPMPLPENTETDENHTTHPIMYHYQNDNNYDIPKTALPVPLNCLKNNDVVSHYDTPKNVLMARKQSLAFANYDIPPAAVPVDSSICKCSSKTRVTVETSMEKCQRGIDFCSCRRFTCSHQWSQFPFHLGLQIAENFSHLRKIIMMPALPQVHPKIIPNKNLPIYATVDLSKKTRNKIFKNYSSENQNSYMNVQFKNEEEIFERMSNLNYMNLEFTNSLQYYENMKDFLKENSATTETFEGLNIQVPDFCQKCGHISISKSDDKKNNDGSVCERNNHSMTLGRHDRPSEKIIIKKSASSPVLSEAEIIDSSDKEQTTKNGNSSECQKSKIEQEINDPEPKRAGPLSKGVRRLSSITSCKSPSNRDSSSSNDSGFSTGSLKFKNRHEFTDFELPTTTSVSSKRHYSFQNNIENNSNKICHFASRRSRSSDPLREFTCHVHKEATKSASAEAELPLCSRKRNCCKECLKPNDMAAPPYIDCRSTSSGASDMSDYFETLSLSSHSSSEVAENLRLHQSGVTTLRPRFGIEYQKIDRKSLLRASKGKDEYLRNKITVTPVLEIESISSGYSSDTPTTTNRM